MTAAPLTPNAEELQRIEEKARDISPGIVSVDRLPAIPDGENVPTAALAVLCMSACGMSKRQIASVLGCHPSNIDYYKRRYDPTGEFRMNPAMIRAYALTQVRSVKLHAVALITPQKLEEATAKELSEIALRMSKMEHFSKVMEDDTDDRSRGSKLISELRSRNADEDSSLDAQRPNSDD